MDDLLPSYESATDRDHWQFVARYLASNDLCSAALVCRKWHAIFTPSLWGNPASHFGIENDVVYVALTRFKRTLHFVRPHIRELTHTLRFPPAHAEIYDGPHSEWLRDCLEYLPRLQCLMVDGLPFFDHSSLLNLRYPSLIRQARRQNTYPTFSLRLLDAADCVNSTSTGLSEALPHFPDLVSLDLSRNASAKDVSVLSKLKYLRNLRVLALRGLGLKDADLAVIAESISTRVRSLDVSHNSLTDSSARLLLEHCLKGEAIGDHVTPGTNSSLLHTFEAGDIEAFEVENLVDHLRHKLTNGFVGSLAIEEARDAGITHLYLTNNAMTVEGVSGLLRSKRLRVLDIGTLLANFEGQIDASPDERTNLRFPAVSKLAPILSKYASKRLKYLRVNYELVTEDAPREPIAQSPRAELLGDGGNDRSNSVHELEVVPTPVAELDATDTVVVEIEGDHIQPVELSTGRPSCSTVAVTPTISISSESMTTTERPRVPKSMVSERVSGPAESTQFENRATWTCLSPLSPTAESNSHVVASQSPMPSRSGQDSFHYIEDRKARLELRQSGENRLHPGMLPRIHTLVLTDVPVFATNLHIVTRLTQFIKDAAEETSIARQRAKYSYVLPPGRNRALAEQEYAHNLFNLRRIVLEMAPSQAVPKKISSSWRAYPTKSSTEDPDSEAFWDAATQDFSFFDDQECGLPTNEPGRTLPLNAMSGLEIAPTTSEQQDKTAVDISQEVPLLDIVNELGKFRKERKAAYSNLVQVGDIDPDIEGYWPGEVTILRKHTDVGELDCYGNRYESGWFYR